MKLKEILEQCGFLLGRMICPSKSYYMQKMPSNNVVFNGNIVSKNQGKVWYGDLDLTLEADQLQKICNLYGQEFLVLQEMDCRFKNENKEYSFYETVAKMKFTPS